MNTTVTHLFRLAAAASLLALGAPAQADDAEIFSGAGNVVAGQRPNILFVMDTSGSMDTNVTTQVPYNPATTYSGSCSSSRVYFVQGSNSNNPPSCSNSNSFPTVAFKCNAATTAMATAGYYIADRAAQWRGSPLRWRGINGNTGNTVWVECRADAGLHGDGVNPTALWATDSGTGWTANSAQQIGWNANGANNSYVFYSANYLNWLRNASTITQTRLQIVQQVATDTINQLVSSNNVNVGLMQFSNNTNNGCSDTGTSEGGMVLREIGPVATHGPLMVGDIALLNADGCTPLSEAMYEAFLYLSGGRVNYGINSRKFPGTGGAHPSILTSRQPVPNTGIYQSPLTVSCQRNFIVLLTDGLPTADNSANTAIQGLIGRNCTGSGDGRCLEEIAQYMYENDLSPLPGVQNASTYTIGFGNEVAGSTQLRNTAAGAGGVFYEASDTATLSTVLTNIVRTILAFNTSFTAPAVSVNAFNRTQNLSDLYVTVFRPSETYNWLGNIKKYELGTDGTILDVNDNPAVELSTGFFRTTAQSIWSTVVDGDDVRLGGAAALLPAAASRNVYSNVGASSLLSANGNHVVTTNAAITTAMLGLGAAEPPGRDPLINWLRGADIADENGNGSTADSRLRYGDPMHGRPATVIYGGSVSNPNPLDGVLYAVTNEGYLHAVDGITGNELWAFMPAQLLARARDMYVNDAVAQRTYGLDGNIRVLRHEVNTNGVLEPLLGERVYIFFGMRMGGHELFGLNVTDRNNPILMWKIGPSELGLKRLPAAGQSWSTPTVARINVAGATQNAQQYVLVFGGGYDTVQENGPYAVDANGNQVFMVDALSGNLLWYAGPSTDTGADLRHASMTHSIPGDVRVFDLSGDGFADRMYAADMGGRVWRFDIHNGQNRANLVTGGVFASLGNAHLSTHPAATTRRFYNAPDVSVLSQGGRTWLNVALGSGYRGHPLNLDTQDRFYSLRDHRPFARLTQAQYDAIPAITEADVNLIDVTTDIAPTIPAGASGWRLDLRRQSGPNQWVGEKSLSESRTIQSMIQFSTYEPHSASTVQSTSCAPGVGQNRLYTVSAYTGAPVYDRESPTSPPDEPEDRHGDLSQGGIAPEVVWLFPPCTGPDCDPQCLVGLEDCGENVSLAPVRTFWRQTGVN